MRWRTSLAACAILWSVQCAALASSVDATIAAPCGHVLFTGTADGSDLRVIVAEEGNAVGDAAAVQHYRFEMDDQRYVYVAVCRGSCDAIGMLAELYFNGIAIETGDPAWESIPVPCEIASEAFELTTLDVAQQVRRANHHYAWKATALKGANGTGGWGFVDDISNDAAWIWCAPNEEPLEAQPGDVPEGHCCVIFRIAPSELWPEIELWHGRNAGRGPSAAGTLYGSSRNRYRSGGGGGGGVSSARGASAGSPTGVHGIGDPFPSSDPPNSSSIESSTVKREPSDPILPPPDEDTPEDSSSMNTGKEKPTTGDDPVSPPPPDDPPPVVPEPSSALLLLATVGIARRR